MPLPPLPDPKSIGRRIQSLSIAIPTVAYLGTTLLAGITVQSAAVAVRPFSRAAFRKVNRWAADTWWGICVSEGERLYDVRLVLTGDEIPMRENSIVVINHQSMSDITFLMSFARSKDRLGDMKWFVKKNIKYVPGVGWGLLFLDNFFVERSWTEDRASIESTFKRILEDDIPIWLLTFPEGTRVSEKKVQGARAYAKAKNLEPLSHLLIPRTKGFAASVQGLRSHIDAVYDLTLGYEKGVPTLWQYIKGYAPQAHMHVRRFPIQDLPEDTDALSQWLHERFRVKDALLSSFYEKGAFPSDSP
jgi:1-acyl-sn-glycerol-3-phosphate acyltransferase